MKRITFLLIALMLVLVSTRLLAQVPRIINYQGMLLDLNKQPVAEGEYQITFRIYDFEGTELWSEVHPKVNASAGMFGVVLGMVSPLGIDFDKPLFLGIQVGSDPELEPRMQLTSAAYSLNSDRVQGYGVNESPTPHTLLPLDANGKVPADALPAGGSAGDYLRKNSPDTSRGTSSSPMLLVSNLGNGDGINGRSINGLGISGRSENNDGVVGWTGANEKAGVRGFSTNGRGIVGRSDNNDGIVGWTGTVEKSGVYGYSTSGIGVTGRSDNDYGVIGWTGGGNDKSGILGQSVNGVGVTGKSNGSSGVEGVGIFGVYGSSNYERGIGVTGYGEGTSAKGVSGGTNGDNSTGVEGRATGQNTTGVFGEANNGIGVEGHSRFGTAIYARGTFTASGTKSAEVKLDDGTPIRLFSEEATEVYFTDYGDGTLQSGRAHIELDPRFLQTVTIDAAHPLKAFIQLEGDCKGVYVTNKTSTGFDVVELQGGESYVPFTYRVVCKRKYFEDQRMPSPEINNQQNSRMMQAVWPEIIEKKQVKLPINNL